MSGPPLAVPPAESITTPPVAAKEGHHPVGYDDFVDRRIRQTRLAVKTADLAAAVVVLLVGLLAFLLLAAIAEHWFVTGGFTPAERLGLFGVGAVGVLVYSLGRIAPIALRTVNPLYAAREIERDAPTLKNSIVNLLQLRSAPRASAPVRQTLERQAAERLAKTGDTAVDRAPLVRAAWCLLALVLMTGLYGVLSPKNFFVSAGRIVMPWSRLVAPTRVRIDNVEPGEASLAQGERLEVSAFVTGVDESDRVELVYSSIDESAVNRRVAMRASETGVRHSVVLPPGEGADAALGLQSALTYRIEAGDARTTWYDVRVLASPSIAPLSVLYEFPDYTGYPDREVEGAGDLRAVEGTRVTITAEANLPIESAQVDLRADGRPDVRMSAEGKQAIGRFTMRLSGDSRSNESSSYLIRFVSADGQTNHSPPTYLIETIADLSPETAVLQPDEPEIRVAVDETVWIEIEARDPDFALSRVTLVGEHESRRVLLRELITDEHRGRLLRRVSVIPRSLDLKPGDSLTYWVEAEDNRKPEANQARSSRKRMLVIGSDPGRQQERADQPQEGQAQERESDEGQPPEDAGGQADQNRPQENAQNQQGQSPPQADRPQGDQQAQPEGADPQQDSGESGGPPPPGGLQGEGNPSDTSGAENLDGGQANPSSNKQNESSRANPQGNSRDGDPNDQSSTQQKEGNPAANESKPVASDGSDDRSAFDRIRDFLDQQDQEPSESGSEPREQPESANESSDGENRRGERSEDVTGRPREDPSSTPDRADPNESPQDGDQPGEQSDSISSDPGSSAEPGQPTEPNSAPREGAGDSGQSQAADQGGGQSGDRGAGETSGRQGEQESADQPTGRPGDRPGEGASTRETDQQESAEGGEAGEATGDQDTGDPADASDSDREGSRQDDSPRGRGEAGESPQESSRGGEAAGQTEPSPGAQRAPSAESQSDSQDGRGPEGRPEDASEESLEPGQASEGGAPGRLRGPNEPSPEDDLEPGGDKENLDYAREQTDLILDRLEERLSEREPDESLLEKLGWTEDELRRFVQRWRQRQAQASRPDAKGRGELDDALRSLGLKPGGPRGESKQTQDNLRDLRERARGTTPPALRDALRWYNRSVSRAGETESAAPSD